MFKVEMQVGSAGRANVVVEFPKRATGAQRFSVSERIIIVNCTARLRLSGIGRVDLHTLAEHGDPEFGDFLLFYNQGQSWSRWGLGCCGRGFLLWRSSTGASCGYFDTLNEALDALAADATPIAATIPARPANRAPVPTLLTLVPPSTPDGGTAPNLPGHFTTR
jgi:hypothetical protein